MTIQIRLDQVCQIYEQYIHAGRLVDEGRLAGAVEAPFVEFQGLLPYPTVVEKAAKLCEGISRAQAYMDGNKRLAWLSTTTFLQLNGLVLVKIESNEAAGFVVSLSGTPEGIRGAARWLNDRIAPPLY